jgi:hypothetical protein
MHDARISIRPERGHPDTFRFSYSIHDGEVTGRVAIALEGPDDTRTSEQKMRAAKLKVQYLVDALGVAVSEARFAEEK